MMRIQELIEKIRSGVIHIEFHKDNVRVASGSGFMSNGYLITNSHVFCGPENSDVIMAWQSTKDISSRTEISLSREEFVSSFVTGSDKNNHDFAILNLPSLRNKGLHQFELLSPENSRIGDNILVIGFPLEHRNLTCHLGAISSFHKSGSTNVIQLDASVNQSNSGGPLVDASSGKVIGIVTRKATGLSKMFDELLSALEKNNDVIAKAGNWIFVGGVDLMGTISVSNQKIRSLASEIQRSANVGIGYAFSVEHLLNDFYMLQNT